MWGTVLRFLPSGIRAKRPDLPARRSWQSLRDEHHFVAAAKDFSPRGATRLQGLPLWFTLGEQPDPLTYKQLGNGVAVGAAYHVFRSLVKGDLVGLA